MSANAQALKQRKIVSSAIDKLLASTHIHLPLNNKPSTQWQYYTELYDLGKELMGAQDVLNQMTRKKGGSASEPAPQPIEKRLDAFRAWMTKNGADVEAMPVEWKAGFKEGLGLVAKRDIKKDETLITVPRSIFMTSDDAIKSRKIRDLLEDRSGSGSDARQLPANVLLALFLLQEKHTPGSKWKPYIDILPESHPIPFGLEPADVEHMRGTSVFLDFARFYRDMLRAYVVLHAGVDIHRIMPLHRFTLAEWRWAMCTIYTRQNRVPAFTLADLQKLEQQHTNDAALLQRMQEQMQRRFMYALIPGWDMFNHRDGYKITSELNIADGNHHCMAPDDFQAGQQVYLGYTEQRANRDRLLYSGYLATRINKNDFLRVAIMAVPKTNAKEQLRRETILREKFNVAFPYPLDISSQLSDNFDNILGIVSTMFGTDADLTYFESLSNIDPENRGQPSGELLALNRQAATDKFLNATEPIECRQRVLDYVNLQVNLLLRNIGGSNEEDEKEIKTLGKGTSVATQLRRNVLQYRIFERNLSKAVLKNVESLASTGARAASPSSEGRRSASPTRAKSASPARKSEPAAEPAAAAPPAQEQQRDTSPARQANSPSKKKEKSPRK
ncbi:Histone-lysine N-methyltransferase setd3 [Sorochytrium milnesiophthora]